MCECVCASARVCKCVHVRVCECVCVRASACVHVCVPKKVFRCSDNEMSHPYEALTHRSQEILAVKG